MLKINVTDALERFDNDREIYLELLETFLGLPLYDFAEMKKMIGQNDAFTVMQFMHKIKGGALTIGAEDLARVTGKLEESIRTSAKDDFKALLQEVERIYPQTLEALKGIRDEFRAQG